MAQKHNYPVFDDSAYKHTIAYSLSCLSEQGDWSGVAFETMEYRGTGTYILKALDDIQMLLDDQIIKTQSMRASPYIGPFEDRVRLWEKKLNLTQVPYFKSMIVKIKTLC